MQHEFAGKVVFVTGGSKGAGRGICERFLAHGATVVTCARRAPEQPLPGAIFRQLGILDFRWRLAQFKNDLILTLASYNAGVAGVQANRSTADVSTPCRFRSWMKPARFAERRYASWTSTAPVWT